MRHVGGKSGREEAGWVEAGWVEAGGKRRVGRGGVGRGGVGRGREGRGGELILSGGGAREGVVGEGTAAVRRWLKQASVAGNERNTFPSGA